VGTLSGIIAVVRASASRKDDLRQAQIALAAAPGTLGSVHNSPLALIAGAPAGPSEFPLSKALRGALSLEMAGLNRFWPGPLARRMRSEAAVVDARTAQLMLLVAAHRLHGANTIENRSIQPLVTRLGADIATASTELVRGAQAADQTAWIATLGVAGVAGLLLVLSLLGLAAARRRRERAEGERQLGEVERTVLRESEERLKALVEHGSDMITVVGADSTVLYQAGAVLTMLGYEPHELEGSKLTNWLDPDDSTLLLALCATERSARLPPSFCETPTSRCTWPRAWEKIVTQSLRHRCTSRSKSASTSKQTSYTQSPPVTSSRSITSPS
jgi:PAS domain-containing protein